MSLIIDDGVYKSIKTTDLYKNAFKRFINEDFAKKDIRKINRDWLEDYTLVLIKEKHLRDSALTEYKTLLNLIFEQAIRDDFIHENIAKRLNNKDHKPYCDQSLSHRKSEDVFLMRTN